MSAIRTVFRREFAAYFATPVALVFIVIYLMVTGAFTFYVGGFYGRGQADLQSMFVYQPWLYLFLIPSVSMRLWAEERKSGSLELLLTLPMPLFGVVIGKFLAAWAFTSIALGLTFPLWMTVNYLGDPDNGVVLSSYIGSALMAGGFLAIGSALSALTKNQVVAFVASVTVCFIFTVSGLPLVLEFFQGWAPEALVNAVAGFSFLTHFTAITQGVIDLRDILYFGSLITFWLFANYVIVDYKRDAG